MLNQPFFISLVHSETFVELSKRVKMSLDLFNTVPVGAVEVLFDCDNQPWFKRAHVGKFLELEKIVNVTTKGLDKSRNVCHPRKIWMQPDPVMVGLDSKRSAK